ncbi:ABC transporter permease subunit [Lentibacter algarum]|uniref:ABC transporter permease subunit n=1 Tax=Lentibacter algarum TaxID=576131 RepID=UPI001C0A10B2|nr:ABC transporter permease subunit [Lentibacter algarum]MBU2983673.1 ABC transporter permease subunit [Lentibacter algarum]
MKTIRNQKVQRLFIQYGFLGSLLFLLIFSILIARDNLAAQGITSGFAFLQRTTGWEVGFSLIPYEAGDNYGRVILVGFLNTLLLGAITLPLATVLGVIVGVMRTLDNKMSRIVGTTYVEIFRNIPLILQLLVWYALLRALPPPRSAISIGESVFLTGRGIFMPGFNVPALWTIAAFLILLTSLFVMQWFRKARRFYHVAAQTKRNGSLAIIGIGLVVAAGIITATREAGLPLVTFPSLKGLNFRGGLNLTTEISAMILAISVYGGAYIAEIIRAGFNAVPSGQAEAGRAVGLSEWNIFSRIRLPLAVRIVMPTLINQYVWLMKATTLGVAIGFSDYFAVISTSISQSGQTLELIGLLMGGFVLVNYFIAWALNRLNDAIKLQGTQLRI